MVESVATNEIMGKGREREGQGGGGRGREETKGKVGDQKSASGKEAKRKEGERVQGKGKGAGGDKGKQGEVYEFGDVWNMFQAVFGICRASPGHCTNTETVQHGIFKHGNCTRNGYAQTREDQTWRANSSTTPPSPLYL